MSGLTLSLHTTPPPGHRLDLSGIIPSALRQLSLAQMERLPLKLNGTTTCLADWFKIAGQSDTSHIQLLGDLSCCDRVGYGLDDGVFDVDGSVGLLAGYRMRGGSLNIRGNASHLAGSEMRGGQIIVSGDTGDYVGGAEGAGLRGMCGGTLIVHGNVGRWAAHRMRKGLLILLGSVSTGLAMRMIAGTVVCCEMAPEYFGVGMRRGTLLMLGGRSELAAPHFTRPEESELSFLPILLHQIQKSWSAADQLNLSAKLDELPRRGLRSIGDRTIKGLGEAIFLD